LFVYKAGKAKTLKAHTGGLIVFSKDKNALVFNLAQTATLKWITRNEFLKKSISREESKKWQKQNSNAPNRILTLEP